MLMLSGAQLVEFFGYVGTIRHKPCWFENWALGRPDYSSSCCHAELAHVRLNLAHVIVLQQLLHAVKVPAGRKSWMFVYEVSAILTLVIAYLNAELYVPLGLCHALLKPLHPFPAISIHVLV